MFMEATLNTLPSEVIILLYSKCNDLCKLKLSTLCSRMKTISHTASLLYPINRSDYYRFTYRSAVNSDMAFFGVDDDVRSVKQSDFYSRILSMRSPQFSMRTLVAKDSFSISEMGWAMKYYEIKLDFEFVVNVSFYNALNSDITICCYIKSNEYCRDEISYIYKTDERVHLLPKMDAWLKQSSYENFYKCDVPWNEHAATSAMKLGGLVKLQHIHSKGCPINRYTCYAAINEGRLDCLTYLIDSGSCKFDSGFYDSFEFGKNTEDDNILQYLIKNKCPYGETNIYRMLLLAKNKRLVIQCIIDSKIKLYPIILEYAIGYSEGTTDHIDYLLTKGCVVRSSLLKRIVSRGDLFLLQRIHTNYKKLKVAIPWTFGTAAIAAKNGNIDCLKYLHEQGCPLTAHSTTNAAEQGHLDCLIYLHENNCKWTSSAYKGAVKKNRTSCISYLVDNECPQK